MVTLAAPRCQGPTLYPGQGSNLDQDLYFMLMKIRKFNDILWQRRPLTSFDSCFFTHFLSRRSSVCWRYVGIFFILLPLFSFFQIYFICFLFYLPVTIFFLSLEGIILFFPSNGCLILFYISTFFILFHLFIFSSDFLHTVQCTTMQLLIVIYRRTTMCRFTQESQ